MKVFAAIAAACASLTLATAAQAGVAGAGLPAGQKILNQYIVVLNAPKPNLLGVTPDVRTLTQAVLTQVGGGQVLQHYQHALLGFAARITPTQAQALSKLPAVKLVEQDQIKTITGTQSGATWGLDRVDQRNLPLTGTYTYPDQRGLGVHVYVIDTGLNAAHSEFTGRIGNGRNFAPNTEGTAGQPLADFGVHPNQVGVPLNFYALDSGTGIFKGPTNAGDTTDCNGHGSHVAGTIAGTVYGVAKRATVHPVRVLGCAGAGEGSSIIAAIDWVAANHVKPAVANMSLSGGASAAEDLAVTNAIARGVTFVVAASNDASDACNYSPARVPNAITVGASTTADSRDTGYSNYGTCVDLFAPGTDVTSAYVGGASATSVLSGTSMASPHVAGAAALVLGASPTATPGQVTDAILGDATLGVLANVGDGSPNALLHVAP